MKVIPELGPGPDDDLFLPPPLLDVSLNEADGENLIPAVKERTSSMGKGKSATNFDLDALTPRTPTKEEREPDENIDDNEPAKVESWRPSFIHPRDQR
jgi:hypothetical protein